MADQWYYWHDTDVLGPFSSKHLAGLAATGAILPTDTVWKGGVESGVPASSVKHLFSVPSVATTVPVETPASTPATAAATIEPEKPLLYPGAAKAKVTRRAVAGKGAIIIGQDGNTVKFRKKCTACGYEDTSWKSLPITRGTMRVSFYCPKCRRNHAVEVQGHVS